MANSLSVVTNELLISFLSKNTMDIRALSKATGLNYDWLIKFKAEKIKDPSVNKVQTLYEYLSGKPLIVEQERVL